MATRRISFSDALGKLGGAGGGSLFGGGGAGEGKGDGRDEPPAESVSALAERIKGALEGIGSTLRVRGEVSNFSARNHWYFSLKDEGAVIGCAMWQSDVARQFGARGTAAIEWMPREGEEVIATGSVSFYGPQGRTQLYVRKLERVGKGSLQERFEALCQTLRAKGWFDESRKRPLPAFPRRVAIVTSATGAALQDCLRTAKNRLPAVGLIVVDVRVQGDAAAGEVARAIRGLDRAAERLGIDAVVVTRGGGSIEDLWAFNELVVAEAIAARTRVPIVAAIGHESDTTIAELVADRRASTPTQAITMLVPDRAELLEQVDQRRSRLISVVRRAVVGRRELLIAVARHPFLRSPLAPIEAARAVVLLRSRELRRAVAARIDRDRHRLRHAAAALEVRSPAARLRAARDALAQRRERLESALSNRMSRASQRLAAQGRQLEAVAPTRVLARGFSYTLLSDGTLLRSVAQGTPGASLITVVADGRVRSVVGDDAGSARREERPGPRDRAAPNTAADGLFGA